MSKSKDAERDLLPPSFKFEVDKSLAAWNIPANEWLQKHREQFTSVTGVATGCIVFNPDEKLLVIQRASTDSMPNKWEIPGGAVNNEDQRIFHGAARELAEEAGLIAKRFTFVVTEGPDREPGQIYPNSTHTKFWCRFVFSVEVENCENVRVNSSEHQGFAWVTEGEIREQSLGERELPLTNQSMQFLLLEAFRLRKDKRETL